MTSVVVKTREQNATLTLEPELLRQAKEAGIGLSQLLATALKEKLRETAAEAWKRENAEAMADLNRHMAQNGLFSDEHRKF
ncbi:type II toxin-antitoxin system CcdA family antitoxin [Serratia fonticola]|uniref:type II toxin-antitoxin system CcdA family antitoxin n=1 Tax=Serratia fonticola TaxID=47917 RepID=UPI0034C60874